MSFSTKGNILPDSRKGGVPRSLVSFLSGVRTNHDGFEKRLGSHRPTADWNRSM